jgi:hypothetical protein
MSDILVSLRPVGRNKDDTLFSLTIMGKQIDHAKLVSYPKEIVDLLRKATEHLDLVYGDLVWSSPFKPNVRVVNKFGEGRVFVIGGSFSLDLHHAMIC